MDIVQNSCTIISKKCLVKLRGREVKIIISIFLVLVLGLSLGLDIDESGMQMQTQAFDRAMIAFGLAKGLNAVISLLQGTELSFTPVGIGLNFSIGEVLDPFNDMVERFSWVMLFASVSLGVQKLLLLLSAKLFVQVVFVLSILVTITLLWVKKLQNSVLLGYSLKAFLLLLLLRLSAVFFIFLSQIFYTSTLQKEYETASQVVEQTKIELENISSQNKNIRQIEKSSGFFSQMNAQYNGLSQSLNISKQLDALQKNIENASRKIISLITIFIVQSLLLPLVYLWLLVMSFRTIVFYKLR